MASKASSNSVTSTTSISDNATTTPQKFVIKEKILRPDCLDVFKVPSEEVVYTIKGKVLHRDGEKVMLDSRDNSRVFKMTEDINSWRQKMYMYDYRDNTVYNVRKAGFLPGKGRNILKVFRGKESDGGTHIMDIITNSIRTRFRVEELASGESIATVVRKPFAVRRLLAGRDIYNLTVNSATADLPFIFMLVVSMDEQYSDYNT